MPNSLIINSNVVINANLDYYGRNATFTSGLNVGNTVINGSSITVSSLVVGSISTSGAGGSSTGFNITGNGSFTGALSAGSLATLGTFSAGNTIFNGTVTLGNIGLQNGSITVGGTTINTNGMTNGGVTFGYLANAGFYFDTVNLALRPPTASGTVYFQPPGGTSNFATFSPAAAVINTSLSINNGALNVTNGNVNLVGGSLVTDYSGNGGVRLVNGGAGQTGYMEFRSANTSVNRLGYIGFGPTAGGAINVVAEAGSYYNFSGAGSAPQVNGSPIVTNSTLSSQLGGYATTAQLGGYAPLSGAVFTGQVQMSNGSGTRYAIANQTDWLIRGISGNRLQICDGPATVEYLSFGTDGSISTRQFGDLNNRIEARGSAWADNAVNRCVTSARWIYVADKGYNDQPGTGGFISPFGGHTMHCDYWSWRFAAADGQVGSAPFAQRFRAFQIYIPNQGYITIGAAS